MSHHSVPGLSDLLLDQTQVVFKQGFYQDLAWSAEGVTEQFIGDAETYHQRFFDRCDFTQLVDRCLTLAAVDRKIPLRLLDIRSGSGCSVFPACALLPHAEVVACDISPQLLELLAGFIASKDLLRGRVSVCCFDLHRPFFKPDCFDVVLGAAILHHLLDPYAALKNVATTLRPGGRLILVEPLEAGSLMLVALFDRILSVLAREGIEEGPLPTLMRAMRLDIQSRLGVPVAKPWTAVLDDKWVFDENYVRHLGVQLGFSTVEIFPANAELSETFRETVQDLLNVTGNADIPVPDVVWDAIREFDEGLSPTLKERFCPTGILVFSKA